MNGASYTYGSQPHAVTAVGQASYVYDDNGNMTTRDDQTITWDVENRAISVTDGQNTTSFVYDGNGNRVKKTEGGETTVYVNRYYKKNLDTEEVTTYYYLGERLIAQRKGTDLSYMHQDHLTGTSVMTDGNGDSEGTIKYYPYGTTRSTTGTIDTDKLFTGQRLDETGLYYYGARYYDATIGRFISADSVSPDIFNPQTFNRYSYTINNPLRYNDPTGQWFETAIDIGSLIFSINEFVREPSWENFAYVVADVATTILPFACAGGTIARGIRHGDDVVDTVKALRHADDIIDPARLAVGTSDNIANTTRKVVVTQNGIIDTARGYDSFNAFKKASVPAGDGNAYHHVVEQCQIKKSGFTPQEIHNPDNLIAIDRDIHAKISGYYSRKDLIFTDGLSVREWLAGQPLEVQYEFGLGCSK